MKEPWELPEEEIGRQAGRKPRQVIIESSKGESMAKPRLVKKKASREVQGSLEMPGDEQWDPNARIPPRLKRRLQPHVELILAQVDATNAVTSDRDEIFTMMREEGLKKLRLPNDAHLVHKHEESDKLVYEPPKPAKKEKKPKKDKKGAANVVGPDVL